MHKFFVAILLFLFFLYSCGGSSQDNSTHPPIAGDIEHYLPASPADDLILQRAKSLLGQPLLSVTQKPGNTHVRDSRNYISLACYWWPNPDSDNGKPYIRKDGKVNPETRSDHSDLPKLIEMAQRVELLTSAYQLTGDEAFAHKATQQLNAWFIHEETAMHPHLEHAQMVKGRNLGRSYGVIDTWWLIRVIDSISALKESGKLPADIETGLKAWFTHYLNWLRNSEFGRAEVRSKNNHGTWYDLQVVTFARFVGQDEFASAYLDKITRDRIVRQISMNGRQKYETRRPRPCHYSIYNLSGLMKLAAHGKDLGVDLKNIDRFFSGSLEDALTYLVESMQDVDPRSLMDEYDQTETGILYLNLLTNGWKMFPHSDIRSEILRVQPLVTSPRPFPATDKK